MRLEQTAGIVTLALLLAALPAAGQQRPPAGAVESDVVERVRTELGSISFVLTPKQARRAQQQRAEPGQGELPELQRLAQSIVAEDLYLRVGARNVTIDSVDPICDLLSEDIVEVSAASEEEALAAADVMTASRVRPILYTFYLDRAYLTMAGFQNALDQALELTRVFHLEVEYWPIMDPVGIGEPREAKLVAYRQTRDQIRDQIVSRFGPPGADA